MIPPCCPRCGLAVPHWLVVDRRYVCDGAGDINTDTVLDYEIHTGNQFPGLKYSEES